MQQHAFVIAAEIEKGIVLAEAYAEKDLGLKIKANPDVVTLRYGLLSVEEAREIGAIASQAPLTGDKKVIIIGTNRVYHEAQNALLKLFEEPPQETYLFLIVPTLGGLLSTLRSRVQILATKSEDIEISEESKAFLKASKGKRSALIKKLATGKDEDERRENRDKAILLLNGIEQIAHGNLKKGDTEVVTLLSDIATLRAYLFERAAPVRMILEHVSLVLPKELGK